jgi:hypothetical protein
VMRSNVAVEPGRPLPDGLSPVDPAALPGKQHGGGRACATLERSPGARRALEFEPGHALDHHVVPQSVMTGREKTGNGHLDLNLFAGTDITRQRSTAQVFPQNVVASIADLEPARDLSAEASSRAFHVTLPALVIRSRSVNDRQDEPFSDAGAGRNVVPCGVPYQSFVTGLRGAALR